MSRHTPWASLLAVLIATSSGARSASAQFELAWDQCPGSSSARSNKAFACQDDNAQPMKLVLAFTPPTSLPRFVGYMAKVEISSAESSLPDWWALGMGECRQGALSASLSFLGVLGQCQNPWTGDNTGGGYVIERSPTPGRALLRFAFARASIAPLSSGTRYFGATLLLEAAHASGSDGTRCAGCTAEVCLAVTEFEFDQAEDKDQGIAPEADTFTRSSQSSVVTFNAIDPNANPCGATSRNTTWGRIKTSYR